MKLKFTLLMIAIGIICPRFYSQSFEGIVTGSLTAVAVPAEMQGMEAMFNQTLTAYYKGEKMRMEITSAMQTTVVLANYNAKEVTVLMNMMGNKWAMKEQLTEEDMPGMNLEFEGTELDFSDETRIIAGQTCKKVTIRAPKEEGMEEPFVMVMWYAPGISLENQKSPIPGTPMEYEMSINGITMRYQVTSVKKEPVSDSQFVIPADYPVKTKEEVEKMFPSMGED